MSATVQILKRRYTKLPASDWAAIRAHWEIGNITLSELSDTYGVTIRTIQAHLKKHGVERGSKAAAFAREVKEEVFAKELPEKDITVERGRETREVAYLDCVSIQQAIMRQVDEIKSNPENAYRAASVVKALGIAAAGIERLCTTRLRSLGLDYDDVQEDKLPVLEIRELTLEEVKAIRNGQGSDELNDNQTPISRTTPQSYYDEEGSHAPDNDVIVETDNDNERAEKVRIVG